MNRATIFCENCERQWLAASTLSFFERQALESRPCPECGLYTLACYDEEKTLVGDRVVSARARLRRCG